VAKGAGMGCSEGHDSVRFVLRDRGAVWICVRCSNQIGNCPDGGVLDDDAVRDLVETALKIREKQEASREPD